MQSTLPCLVAIVALAESAPAAENYINAPMQAQYSAEAIEMDRPQHETAPTSPDCLSGQVVYMNGRVAVLCGVLTAEAVEAVTNHIPMPEIVSVRSGGGQSQAAIELADWIDENNILLRIDSVCLSACASFLVLAVDNLEVLPGALIGMHHTSLTLLWRASRPGFLSPEDVGPLGAKWADPEMDFYLRQGIDPKWLSVPDLLTGPVCTHLPTVPGQIDAIYYKNRYDYFVPSLELINSARTKPVRTGGYLPADGLERAREEYPVLKRATFQLRQELDIPSMTKEDAGRFRRLPICE